MTEQIKSVVNPKVLGEPPERKGFTLYALAKVNEGKVSEIELYTFMKRG